MKKVLRSCFDPLPRFLSTRGLAIVVAMLVGGTAISVHEYVESTQPRPRRPLLPAASGEVHAAERQAEPRAARPSFAERPSSPANATTAPLELGPAARSRVEPPQHPPSIWDPLEDRSGG